VSTRIVEIKLLVDDEVSVAYQASQLMSENGYRKTNVDGTYEGWSLMGPATVTTGFNREGTSYTTVCLTMVRYASVEDPE
jgi:hypothetical protein